MDIHEAITEARENIVSNYSTEPCVVNALLAEIDRLSAEVCKLHGVAHKFWGAGEPDCPKDIKAPNGELHTLKCKVCGEENPRTHVCSA